MRKIKVTRKNLKDILSVIIYGVVLFFAILGIESFIDDIKDSRKDRIRKERHEECIAQFNEESMNRLKEFEKSLEGVNFETLSIEEEKNLIEKVRKESFVTDKNEFALRVAVKAGWADEEEIGNGEFYKLVRYLMENATDMYDLCLLIKQYDFIPKQVRDSSENIAIRMFIDKYGYQLK